jgi:hypothetical protein
MKIAREAATRPSKYSPCVKKEHLNSNAIISIITGLSLVVQVNKAEDKEASHLQSTGPYA